MSTGIVLKSEQLPDYFFDFEDAALLGVKPWELDQVPLIYRYQARTVSIAKKEAKLAIAKKAKAEKVYLIEV